MCIHIFWEGKRERGKVEGIKGEEDEEIRHTSSLLLSLLLCLPSRATQIIILK
jgi:hypothetical protein